jgi:predicted transcriptional regulator of viral defense system
MRPRRSTSSNDYHPWRFVTNHAHVLEAVARDPTVRLRDIAQIVGITERTAAQIVNDLVEAGYLTKIRDGRRNHYEVHEDLPLRHPQHRHHTVGELIRFLEAPPEPPSQRPTRRHAQR